jgi:hypothetical protein
MASKGRIGFISVVLLCYALTSGQLIYPLVDCFLPYVVQVEDDFPCAGHDCCCQSKEDCEKHCCCQKAMPKPKESKNSNSGQPKKLSIKALMTCAGTLPHDSELKVLPVDVHVVSPLITWEFPLQTIDQQEVPAPMLSSWIAPPQDHVPWLEWI